MELFNIDNTKCDKDGICAIECPAHIIKMTKEGPVPSAYAEEFCIQCGHCVAVCPKGAFNLQTLSPDQCMPIETKFKISTDQAEHFLRSRRSIRRYKEKEIPTELFEKALKIGLKSGSFTVAGMDTFLYLYQLFFLVERNMQLSLY